MAANEVVMSREGLDKLKAELEEFKTVRREEVKEKIKTARSYGDLSENAEYDAAKEEQAYVEAHIADLEGLIKSARVLDDSDLNTNVVSIGLSVEVLAEGDDPDEAEVYMLTGSTEADVDAGRISDESPMGKALVGKHVGDEAEVQLPNGSTMKVQVLRIFRA